MKKINVGRLMSERKFKLNSDSKVVNQNPDLIFPELGGQGYDGVVRSVVYTPELYAKLTRLRKKYKISRSAIMRILLDSAE